MIRIQRLSRRRVVLCVINKNLFGVFIMFIIWGVGVGGGGEVFLTSLTEFMHVTNGQF